MGTDGRAWNAPVSAVGTALLLACAPVRDPSGIAGDAPWVGTWIAAPQLTEPGNVPPAPGLSGSTLRQIVHPSIGGRRLRVRLSNAYGDAPLEMTSIHLAASKGESAIDPATDVVVTFAGSPSVTIPPGDSASSDPIAYALDPSTTMAVTIAFDRVPTALTGHPGSRTTSYFVRGNAAAAPSLTSATTVVHWYFLSGIDVVADPSSAAVVVLGDSITDGRGSTTDGNDRWPDALSRRLRANQATSGVAVLNAGIGGNAVLKGGLGPPAVRRFAGDVLSQRGARWVIVLEGVNDIGGSTTADVATDLIVAFQGLIDAAHARGMRVYGVPILPFAGSIYASDDHERARRTVNDWIRSSGRFDAVIDLDAVVRDPARPAHLLAAYDSGDGLHLNPTGYRAMADAVDLKLFAR